MKRFVSVFAAVMMSLFSFASQASAAGFALPEQGTAAMGMGSAFVGQADDASAVWYNPAGITQLDGIRVMGGAVIIMPEFSHDNKNGTTDVATRNTHFPILFYSTYKVNEKVSLGFGVNNPFGLATNWQPNYSSTREVATLTKLMTTEFNPNVAYKITDNFSVAAGVNYVYLSAILSSKQFLGGGIYGNSQMNGTGDGWGGNVAALLKISDSVSTGLSYRSRIKIDVKGNAQIDINGNIVPGFAAPATTSITLPDMMTWGFSVRPTNNFTLNLDLGYTWWTTYDKIELLSPNSNFQNKTYEKQWNDVWNVRIGGQYKVTDNFKLRLGYQYDKNPVPEQYFETRVPDSDRHGFSAGLGYSIGNLTFDVAYLYLLFETRHINGSSADDAATIVNKNSLNGTYHANVHCIGFSVAYKF